MYIEFLFCSLYLSGPIWQMHINRWSIEKRESELNKVEEEEWKDNEDEGFYIFTSHGETQETAWALFCCQGEIWVYFYKVCPMNSPSV